MTPPADTLADRHRQLLERESAISQDIIRVRGYRTVDEASVLVQLGFTAAQARVPALVIPIFNVEGNNAFHQIRPDGPREVRNRRVKYEIPQGQRMALDVHPSAHSQLGDPSIPLWITEGIRKGDALVSAGCCAIALLGVFNWRGKNSFGGMTALPDWELIALPGRTVYLAFDSDAVRNHKVRQALERLKSFLTMKRADVAVVVLPEGENGGKVGVDDFLASGQSLHHLLSLAASDLPSRDSDEPGARPQIIVTNRFLRDIVADAWSGVTIRNEPPVLFRRGGLVTDIVRDDGGHPALRTLDRAALRGFLDRIADFMRADRDGGLVPARPPTDVVADMMAMSDLPLPALERIIDVPVFAASGTLVTRPGYQSETRSYLIPDQTTNFAPIEASPSATALRKATALVVEELLVDFPFVAQADLANAIGLLVLPFARLMIDGPTPLHLVESPTPGTGKGLLADVLAIPAHGRGPTVMTEGRDEDEWRKRITAKLILAPPYVLIDNVRSRLDSASLAAVLTSEVWEDRILGQSKTTILPVSTVWVATANNPGLSLEMARRSISVRLDAMVESPWKKTGFRHPRLRRWAIQHRGDLVWACLTIVQAWVADGCPPGEQTMGSYESYAETVGGILGVAGIQGFLANADRLIESVNTENDDWGEVLAAWWDEWHDSTVTTAQVFGLVSRRRLLLRIWGGCEDHSARTRLGNAVARMRDRVVDGFRIIRDGEDSHTKAPVYRLALVGTLSPAGVAGVSGGLDVSRNSDTEDDGARHTVSAGFQTSARPRNTRSVDPWDPFLEADGDPGDR